MTMRVWMLLPLGLLLATPARATEPRRLPPDGATITLQLGGERVFLPGIARIELADQTIVDARPKSSGGFLEARAKGTTRLTVWTLAAKKLVYTVVVVPPPPAPAPSGTGR